MCWQPEAFYTMERAKGTPREVECLVPGAPFLGKDFSRKQPPTSTLQRPAEAHPGHGGLGQKHSVCRYYLHCIYFCVSERKAKSSFVLVDVYPAGKAVAGWQNVPRN